MKWEIKIEERESREEAEAAERRDWARLAETGLAERRRGGASGGRDSEAEHAAELPAEEVAFRREPVLRCLRRDAAR